MLTKKTKFAACQNNLKTARCILFILISFAATFFSSCREAKKQNSTDTSDTVSVSGEVKKYSEQIAADPENPELYYERAKAYRNANRTVQALQDIENAIALDSLNALYHY